MVLAAALACAAVTLSQVFSAPAGVHAAVDPSETVAALSARLTGRPGTVVSADLPAVCAQRDDWGCADVHGNVIYLRGDLLVYLNRISAGEYVQPYLGAQAVMTFAHEARHVRGTLDEAVAETWAYWHAPVIARLLGATRRWTADMRRWLGHWADLSLLRRAA